MEENDKYYCALSKALFYSPLCGKALLEKYPEPAEIFSLSCEEIDRATGKAGTGARLKSAELLEWGKNEAEWYRSKEVKIIDLHSPEYPVYLKECEDSPFVLYFRGSCNLLKKKTIGIIGTRLATNYGKEICETIVESFADKGFNPLVISGLAIGIDIAAHRAALENNLETVGILPCGIDLIYPSSHRETAIKMLSSGGIMSEFPRGMEARKNNFLQRNRIIAGMSQGLVVAESRVSGGSMSTVECAVSYGRDIFAVPGRASDANSYGCNYLISKNVAAIYLNSNTIPDALGWSGNFSADVMSQPDLFSCANENIAKILLTLSPIVQRSVDYIVLQSGLSFSAVSAALLELELEGKVCADDRGDYMLRQKR